MKYWPLFALLFIAACGNAGDQAYSDPYSQRAAADGAIQATSVAIERERKAVEQAVQEDNQKTKNEIARIYAPLEAAETEFALSVAAGQTTREAAQATDSARMVYAQATGQSARATSTQRVADIAIENAQRKLIRQEQRAEVLDIFLLIAALIILLGGAVCAVVFFWRLPEIYNRSKMVKVTEYGVLTYGQFGWQSANAQITQATTTVPRKVPQMDIVEHLGQSVNRSRPAQSDRSLRGKVITLLQDAIELNGAGDTQIPSWTKLQAFGKRWVSETWQEPVNALEELNVVRADNTGTFVVGGPTGYVNLADLLGEIRGGHLEIIPPPLPTSSTQYSDTARESMS